LRLPSLPPCEYIRLQNQKFAAKRTQFQDIRRRETGVPSGFDAKKTISADNYTYLH
jgi:hypothetical protein